MILPTEGATCEGARAGRVKEERVLGIKQKLLAEVLRQKEELEKKQAARLASKVSQSVSQRLMKRKP